MSQDEASYLTQEIEESKKRKTTDSASEDNDNTKKKRLNDEGEGDQASEDEAEMPNKPTEGLNAELEGDEEEIDNSFDLSSDEDEDEEEEAAPNEEQELAASENKGPKEEKDETSQRTEAKSTIGENMEQSHGIKGPKSPKLSVSQIDITSKEALKRKKLEQIEEESKKMQVLMANFSEEQLNRYEMFRRSAFQKSTVKKIIQTVCGKNVSQSVVIAMSGIAKVFVGEIVEKALDVKQKWGDEGPLKPKHLREAYRIFRNTNKLSSSSKFKRESIF